MDKWFIYLLCFLIGYIIFKMIKKNTFSIGGQKTEKDIPLFMCTHEDYKDHPNCSINISKIKEQFDIHNVDKNFLTSTDDGETWYDKLINYFESWNLMLKCIYKNSHKDDVASLCIGPSVIHDLQFAVKWTGLFGTVGSIGAGTCTWLYRQWRTMQAAELAKYKVINMMFGVVSSWETLINELHKFSAPPQNPNEVIHHGVIAIAALHNLPQLWTFTMLPLTRPQIAHQLEGMTGILEIIIINLMSQIWDMEQDYGINIWGHWLNRLRNEHPTAYYFFIPASPWGV